MSDLLPSPAGGRRNLRVLLFVIILATAPLYCIGFVLWGVAPRPEATATASPTLRPATAASAPTRTSPPQRSVIVTVTRPLPPTPRQFSPPVQQPQPGQGQQPAAQPQPDAAQPPAPATSQPPAAVPGPALPATETVVPVQPLDDDG